jgi:hypothetical protein
MTLSEWGYSNKDATRLAAIRWFANSIEKVSIELYATSPTTFAQTEQLLKDCLAGLTFQRQQIRQSIGAVECPDGYELCRGLCQPACESD